jgi:hypothetical protein
MIRTNNFYARDIYNRWKESINKASKSICIISPYIDQTANNLLKSPEIKPNISRKIYTRIDSDTIFEKPYQIKALIDCIYEGVEIYQIEDLHAKVLIIDNKKISVGSQNFTSKGRQNKETSYISDEDFSQSKFLKIIDTWINDANKIDLAYLLKLQSALKKFIPIIKSLRNEHEIEFDKIKNQYDKKRLELLKQKLEEQRRISLIKFASEYIYISKKFITNIWTLKADEGYNLTLWKSDTVDLTKLNWLSWYPMMLVETGKLIFVRLASTRISFYLTKVAFGRMIKIGNTYYDLNITFPQEISERANLIFMFINYEMNEKYEYRKNEQQVKFFFDGEKCEYMESTYTDESHKKRIESYFSSKKTKNEFLKGYFKSIYLEGFGPPVDRYFEKSRYKLYIIQHLENPILVCENVY